MKTLTVHVKENKLLLFAIFLLILNTFLLTIGINFLRPVQSEISDNLSSKKLLAEEIVQYNRRQAEKLEVDQRPRVMETLSRFYYDIELATGNEELYKIILSNARTVQETISREYESYQQELILSLINKDSKIREIKSNLNVTITYDFETGIIVEPEGVIEEKTLEEINKTAFQSDFSPRQIIEIEVENGQGKPVATHNPLDQVNVLTNELNSLRNILYETRVAAGLAEMTGAGIIIRLYDKENGQTSEEIVHDTDIRNLVHELFNSDAQGVAVGDQRIIATSHIRCVGSIIRVNDESIPVNPVVIKAVGNPEILVGGMTLIKSQLEIRYGLRMDIEKVDNLTLPAYSD
ncbi:DUF881 domain-containing protein [Candidatus Contubernalis alkaliaceticus]|uniref:DUF881 domain-containing protein n=1 Tax=Candidatus Contubernalis alkaliaceticus TaxID=338645 RepID=UPI001F4BE035|nr:DUF881 domain-containing protein [Candidatus Contubernalis alkalaceticus]UNC93125.1 DUF881 domain-containing protein [Candidatus Contubernalis alkalaceticus]